MRRLRETLGLARLRLEAGIKHVGIGIAEVGSTKIGELLGPEQLVELIVISRHTKDQARRN